MTLPPARFLRNPIHLFAFGFGAGYSRHAPGSMGTLVAVPLYLILQPLPLAYYALVVAVAFVAGVWICNATANALQVHDHPGIVWDEIVGYWIVMAAAPPGWVWAVAGFVLFRVFDIWKPWPIRVVDRRVQGGFGIMLDDALAAVYAGLVLTGLAWLYYA